MTEAHEDEPTEHQRRSIHDGKVKVWDEVTIRIGVGAEYDFIRFTHGQERLVRNNSRAIARAEREIHTSILEIVEARVEQYKQMVEEVNEEK